MGLAGIWCRAVQVEGTAGVKPQDGVPGVSTRDERPYGESRGTEARLAGLWALPRALAFAQRNVDYAGTGAEKDVAWHRLISVCKGRGRSTEASFMQSSRSEVPKAHISHQGGCEKCSESGRILKVDPAGFPGGPEVRCGRKQGIWSTWMELPSTEMETAVGMQEVWGAEMGS